MGVDKMTVKPVNAYRAIDELTSSLNAQEREEYNYYSMLGNISSVLVEYRAARNLSQSQLAELLGVSQAMISKYESGDYNISLKALNHIAHQLGIGFKCTFGTPTSTLLTSEADTVSENLENTY